MSSDDDSSEQAADSLLLNELKTACRDTGELGWS